MHCRERRGVGYKRLVERGMIGGENGLCVYCMGEGPGGGDRRDPGVREKKSRNFFSPKSKKGLVEIERGLNVIYVFERFTVICVFERFTVICVFERFTAFKMLKNGHETGPNVLSPHDGRKVSKERPQTDTTNQTPNPKLSKKQQKFKNAGRLSSVGPKPLSEGRFGGESGPRGGSPHPRGESPHRWNSPKNTTPQKPHIAQKPQAKKSLPDTY